VIVNLVVNARDAMPEGGAIVLTAANVDLSGYETAEGLSGEFVALTVSDNGLGIAPDVIGKVFEPFFTTKSAEKGTGLGMSQAYGFARQSGGAIKVASEVGRGTQVTIYLPRSKEPLDKVDTAAHAEATPGRGECILVVEDNPDVKAVATAMLEQLDYRTHAVDNAAAALDTLKSGKRIDLVFTDVMLQGDTDGLTLAQAIRKRYPKIPVVLTSGYARALSVRHGLPILRKPYQLAALGQTIRENLSLGPRGEAGGD
jgi:CheY-like chemotaxis protein